MDEVRGLPRCHAKLPARSICRSRRWRRSSGATHGRRPRGDCSEGDSADDGARSA